MRKGLKNSEGILYSKQLHQPGVVGAEENNNEWADEMRSVAVADPMAALALGLGTLESSTCHNCVWPVFGGLRGQ